jgi:hypothetical protein
MKRSSLVIISILLLSLIGCGNPYDKKEHPLGLIVTDDDNIMVRANNGNKVLIFKDENGKNSINVSLFELDNTIFSITFFDPDDILNSVSAHDFNEWVIPNIIFRTHRTDDGRSTEFFNVDFTLIPVVFGGDKEDSSSD